MRGTQNGDLFGDIGGRDNGLGGGNAVVLHKADLRLRAVAGDEGKAHVRSPAF